MTIDVVKNEAAARYEIIVDGERRGLADYEVVDDVVVMPHTVIDRAARGRGLAARLVTFALDDIRSQGRRVVPTCWYVAQFIERNPAYADLLDG